MINKERAVAITYGLRLNPRPSLIYRYLVLCVVLSALSVVLSWLAVITVPGGFLGVGAFYFASVFYALITYWFGAWGLIASFVGAFVGAGLLSHIPLSFAVPFALADIWEPLIPFMILRLLPRLGANLDPLGANILKRFSHILIFMVCCAALPPFVSGIWGTWILLKAGIVPPEAYWVAVFSWWFGAAILLAVLVPTITKGLAVYIRTADVACHGWFS